MSKLILKVVHLTSVHLRYDSRIFEKMCTTLAATGYKVSLVVADGIGEEVKNSVSIFDVGRNSGSRLYRMTRTIFLLFIKARQIDADLYHIHDPELIPVGLILKRLGKRVIYDSHEDTKNQILIKPYLNKILSTVLSKTFEYFEKNTLNNFSGIITTTNNIKSNYRSINSNLECIMNYPIMGDITFHSKDVYRENLIYIGGISPERGIIEILDSLDYVNSSIKINLCGNFFDKTFENKVKAHHNWKRVIYHGFVNKKEIEKLLVSSLIGVVTLQPTITYLDSLPVKLFEYARSGLPVICSNFPLWIKLFAKHKFTLFVDPYNPHEIANAINKLSLDNTLRKKLSENSKKAFLESFNWRTEESKLLNFYQKILNY